MFDGGKEEYAQKRNARLIGVREASILHEQLNLANRVRGNRRPIDIFKIISKDLKVPLLFKDLDNLEGICLKDPSPGILINSKKLLSRQRFTAAHELGHHRMGHGNSLDQEIFQIVDEDREDRPLEEVSANWFAHSFLFPRWLYTIQGRGLGIKTKEDAIDPNNVYQLSLRMGASYEATIYGLRSNNIISPHDVTNLKKVKPINLKKKLFRGEYDPDPRVDVWKMTESDHDRDFDLKEGDYVRLELPSRSPMGYTWGFKDSCFEENLDIIHDFYLISSSKNLIGGREKVAGLLKYRGPGVFKLELEERRSWLRSKKVIKNFSTNLTINKANENGIPSFMKPQILS
ncbi:MAG: ImmA/IrrE family metallo-endopeptidase [Bacteriovoracales bacterium]|nr:ImmA/IrrE family metallo-endopeptidase [Bacteriovoracales bacterium]